MRPAACEEAGGHHVKGTLGTGMQTRGACSHDQDQNQETEGIRRRYQEKVENIPIPQPKARALPPCHATHSAQGMLTIVELFIMSQIHQFQLVCALARQAGSLP